MLITNHISSIQYVAAEPKLYTELTETFDATSDKYDLFFKVLYEETNVKKKSGIVTEDNNSYYKIEMSGVRELRTKNANLFGGIMFYDLHPSAQNFSVDILGNNLRGDGGEVGAGAAIYYAIVYDTGDAQKQIMVRTHALANKNVALINTALLKPGETYPEIIVIKNQFTPIDTWATFTGNVKQMYEDNDLGNYDEDVTEWIFMLGGSTYTSQVNGRPNSFEAHFDNVTITRGVVSDTKTPAQIIEELKAKITSLKGKIAKLTTAITGLNNTISEKDKTIEKLNMQIKTLNSTSGPTVISFDNFETGLGEWTFYSYQYAPDTPGHPGFDNYSAQLISDDSKVVKISGDGHPVYAGIKKELTIPVDAKQVILSFDGKASGAALHNYIPSMLFISLDNPGPGTYPVYYKHYFVGEINPPSSKLVDWKKYELDITQYTKGKTKSTIFLGLLDSWAANWNHQVWFDNIKVIVKN